MNLLLIWQPYCPSVVKDSSFQPFSEAGQQGETGEKGKASGKIPAIRLNELVKKPQNFDGYNPPARKWVDDYEKAAEANGWSQPQKVKYFSTFLEKSAND